MLKQIFPGGITGSPFTGRWGLTRAGYREFHPWG
jgi:hypothetical protein